LYKGTKTSKKRVLSLPSGIGIDWSKNRRDDLSPTTSGWVDLADVLIGPISHY